MPKRSLVAAVLGPLGLVAMMGATDCEDFDLVVVPANDAIDPLLGTRMLVDGDDQVFWGEVDIETHDPSAEYVIFPFVVDAGGARRLETTYHFELNCRDPEGEDPGLGYDADGFPQVDTQNGSVGAQVSNGIYRYHSTFDASDYVNDCQGNQVLESAELSWTARGKDFAGNESVTHNEIVFRPRGICGCENSGLGNICQPAFDECNTGFNPHCQPQSGNCGSCSCQ